MTAPSVAAWSATPGLLSEGPRWHEERQELLWVDILGRQLHRGSLASDGSLERVVTIAIDRHVGAAAPAVRGGYVLAAGQGFLFVDEDGSVRELAQPEAGRTNVRMNDGACDAQGRFWAGTMAYDESPGAGTLYRLELDGKCTAVLTGLTIANGIGWSPDAQTMYLNDSGTGCVEAFSFDTASGAISERRTLVHSDQPGVVPDGLTVDEEGGIWVAPLGRRLGQPIRARRGTARQPAAPGRATDLLRLRWTRPGDPVCDDRSRGARRRSARPPARFGASVLDRRARDSRAPVPALPRTDPFDGWCMINLKSSGP